MTDVSVETPEIMEVVIPCWDAQKATVTYVDGTNPRKKLEAADCWVKGDENELQDSQPSCHGMIHKHPI